MKQYEMKVDHVGSCPQCGQGFFLHQSYEADSGHVYGEIEMCCPACEIYIFLMLEQVVITRIAERQHGKIEDLIGVPIPVVITQKKETKKIPANVTELKPDKVIPDDTIGVREAIKVLKASRSTLRLWRIKGRGPAFIKVGLQGIVRYKRSDVDKFIKENPLMNYHHMRGIQNGDC